MNHEASIIIHDTYIIVRADEEAHKLFAAQPDQLVGVKLLDLISDQDLKGLAALRMMVARRTEQSRLPNVDYIFKRFDGSLFYGHVMTSRTTNPQEWESKISFISEY